MKQLFIIALLMVGCSDKQKFSHPNAVRCDTVRVANSIQRVAPDSNGVLRVVGYDDTVYVIEYNSIGRVVDQTVIDHWPIDSNEVHP